MKEKDQRLKINCKDDWRNADSWRNKLEREKKALLK